MEIYQIAIAAILILAGYLLGHYRGSILERDLAKKVTKGSDVSIFVGTEGVTYCLEDGKIVRRGVSIQKIVEEDDDV